MVCDTSYTHSFNCTAEADKVQLRPVIPKLFLSCLPLEAEEKIHPPPPSHFPFISRGKIIKQ